MTQIGAGFAGSGTCSEFRNCYWFSVNRKYFIISCICAQNQYVDFRSMTDSYDLKSTYIKYFIISCICAQKQYVDFRWHVPDPANPAPICVILMRSSWYTTVQYPEILYYSILRYVLDLLASTSSMYHTLSQAAAHHTHACHGWSPQVSIRAQPIGPHS